MAAASRSTPRRRSAGAAFAALLASALGVLGPIAPAQERASQKPAPKQQPAKKGTAPQQQRPPSPQNRKVRSLTTPDGSRFVLVQDAQQRTVHWALASWTDGRDDPPGFPGLTQTVLHASLGGTWSTGSKDPAAEKAALQALDQAWQAKMANPTDKKSNAQLLRRDQEAAALGDPRTFRRVLAALPAHRPEIVQRDGIAVFSLTTVAPALPGVARLLLERREQQALRGLARAWLPTVRARALEHAQHPERRIQAELLALVMPTSPAIAQLEPPAMTAPQRALAEACWQANQHPTRTVHVLYGSFDLDRTEALLNETFAATALPAPTSRPQQPIRKLGAQRRSIVPGMPNDSVSLGWVLPPNADPWVVNVATRWLVEGDRAAVRRLLRKKRPNLELEVQAPWPIGSTPGLLRIDARDPDGTAGLADDLLAACKQAVAKPLAKSACYRAYSAALRDLSLAASTPRALTELIAEKALAQPTKKVSPNIPKSIQSKQVRQVLTATFAAQPAIVEGRR